MQIFVSGKNLEITNGIKSTVERSITELFAEKSLKITSVRVMVEFEKPRFKVEAIVNMKHHEITASAEDYDAFRALTSVLNKVEVQVNKHLAKLQDHSSAPLRVLEGTAV